MLVFVCICVFLCFFVWTKVTQLMGKMILGKFKGQRLRSAEVIKLTILAGSILFIFIMLRSFK